jgi:putative phosphoesterase
MNDSSFMVGVISDTHGLLDPRLPTLFDKVDYLLHAGDIGSMSVLHGLKGIAPLIAVIGNVDSGFLHAAILPQRTVLLAGTRIWMTHILGNPHKLSRETRNHLEQTKPDIVVFGHTHQPFNEKVDGILFFNPGSAGPRRFNIPRSVGFLDIRKRETRGRIVTL